MSGVNVEQMIQNIHDGERDEDELDLFNYDEDHDEDDILNISNHEASVHHTQRYRYFSTSICSFFSDPKDCCSFVFCGVLESDRSYYLLNGKHPPKSSLLYRLFTYVFVPYILFRFGSLTVATLLTSANENNSHEEDSVLHSLAFGIMSFFPLFVYLVLHAQSIHSWRLSVRRSILKRAVRYDDDGIHLPANTNGEDNATESAAEALLIRKNRVYNTQAHQLCCGCYPRDDRHEDSINHSYSISAQNHDFCVGIWNFFASLCCGSLFGCWCQCFGICALAQEAREVKRVVSKEDQMIDYITFEPFSNYYHKTRYLRSTMNPSLFQHIRSLSQLSTKLIKSLGSFLLFFLIYAILNINHGRDIGDWLMVVATFIQAFFTLYIVYWKDNKFRISLDAMIKYFAAGSILAVVNALTFEEIISLFSKILLSLAMLVTGNSTIGTTESMDQKSEEHFDPYYNPEQAELQKRLEQLDWIKTHKLSLLFQTFLTSFVIAAFVEETCKYFSFYMLDHPDFLDLSSVLSARPSSYNYGNGGTANGQQVGIEMASVQNQTHSNRTSSSQTSNGNGNAHSVPFQIVDSNEVQLLDSKSLLSKGTKITLAMVSVAIGFECIENLLYISKGETLGNELSILLQRSVVPVHPICAAIQSIGVCKRDLENDTSVTIGQILKPAVMLHGFFDFFVLTLPTLYLIPHYEKYKEFIIEVSEQGQEYAVNDPNNFDIQAVIHDANTYTMALAIAIAIFGFGYYLIESSLQKDRLKALDKEAAVLRSRVVV